MGVKRSPLRVAAAACIVCAGFGFVIALYTYGLTAKSAVQRDFIEYWAAGQALVRGANPYDPVRAFQLERTIGLDQQTPKVTLSPPFVMLVAWPLGHLDAKNGLILWLFASLGCLSLSVWILWILNGKPDDSRFHLIGFAFPPALGCLMAGQLGIFFLLEVSLFLYFQKSRPRVAGAVLVLCSLKPHLFVLCFLVLLFWSIYRREFQVLAGFLAALAAAVAAVAFLDPQAWSQYRQLLQSTGLMDAFIPTLGMGFRFLLDRQAKWLEFVPEAAGCLWAAWYFWSRRWRWNWSEEGLLLLLVSVACTPYQWYTDQALLFPAILAGLYRAQRSAVSLASFGVIAAAGLIGVFGHFQLPSVFYIWTAPAWLLWYLFIPKGDRRRDLAIPAALTSAG